MNHGVPWKETCPGEMRQPAAEINGFRAWRQKKKKKHLAADIQTFETGGQIAKSD